MSRNRRLRYGIDSEGSIISELMGGYNDREEADHRIAWPVLDFEHMKPENGFEIIYNLEKMNPYDCLPYSDVTWTRKIPIEVKNIHREFWGLKSLDGITCRAFLNCIALATTEIIVPALANPVPSCEKCAKKLQ